METLVHKTNTNTNERNAAHGHYAPISNTNTATPSAAPIAQQVVVSQPAPIAKAAKPVRDNAQFVSSQENSFFSFEKENELDQKTRKSTIDSFRFSGRSRVSCSLPRCLYRFQHNLLVSIFLKMNIFF